MTRTSLGSPGAARVLAVAEHGYKPGRRYWGTPRACPVLELRADSMCMCGHRKDRVSIVWWLGGQAVHRSTARLLLRGLLAEQMGRELAEWVEDAPRWDENNPAYLHALDDVRDKLRELGLS